MTNSNVPTSEKDRWHGPGYVPDKLHESDRDWINSGTHFYYQGSGPAVFLIHGVGLDLTMWQGQLDALSKDYTVFCYDMLGHGKSAKPPGPRSLKDFSQQLENLRKYFQLDKIAVVGFSLGGFVAQNYALDYPEAVEKLAVLNSGHNRSAEQLSGVRGRYEQSLRDGPQVMIDAALARWLSAEYQSENPDMVQAIRTRLESNDDENFLKAYRLLTVDNSDLESQLHKITCPTLVSTGELDSGSTPDMAKTMSAAFPNSKLEILPNLRHLSPIEGADTTNKMLLQFLKD